MYTDTDVHRGTKPEGERERETERDIIDRVSLDDEIKTTDVIISIAGRILIFTTRPFARGQGSSVQYHCTTRVRLSVCLLHT